MMRGILKKRDSTDMVQELEKLSIAKKPVRQNHKSCETLTIDFRTTLGRRLNGCVTSAEEKPSGKYDFDEKRSHQSGTGEYNTDMMLILNK